VAQCHRCPLKEASGYPLASPYSAMPILPAKHIHRTSARTHAGLPSVINDHTRRVGVQAPVLILRPSSSRQHALYRMGNRERPHRCPSRPTASASTRVRIAPLRHTPSAFRKWRIRQRSAAEGGGQRGSGRLEGPMPQSAEGGKRRERGGAARCRHGAEDGQGKGRGYGTTEGRYSMCCARCGRVVNERSVMAPRMEVGSGESKGP
jgi:hypothetical protein